MAAALTLLAGCQTIGETYGKLTSREAHRIAVDVYLYGYPLVTTEYTRQVMTNVR